MARATSSTTTTTSPQLGPSTVTTTILTLDHLSSRFPSYSSSSQQHTPQTLTLRLVRKKEKKKVTWKEGTVDNEFLQKKSSKKCCIFHKEKPFDEDDSDDDNRDCNDYSEKNNGHTDGCCSHGNGGN